MTINENLVSNSDHSELIVEGKEVNKNFNSKNHLEKMNRIKDLIEQLSSKLETVNSENERKLEENNIRIQRLTASNGELAGVLAALVQTVKKNTTSFDDTLDTTIKKALELVDEDIDNHEGHDHG